MQSTNKREGTLKRNFESTLSNEDEDPIPFMTERWDGIRHHNRDVTLACYSRPGKAVIFRMTERSFLNLCATIGMLETTPDNPQAARMTEDALHAPSPDESMFDDADNGMALVMWIGIASLILIGIIYGMSRLLAALT